MLFRNSVQRRTLDRCRLLIAPFPPPPLFLMLFR
jgi:hypothetical protein